MFVVVVDAQVWTIRVLLRTVCRFCGARLRVPGFSTVPSMPGKLINKREPLTRATGANPLTFCCCCDPRGWDNPGSSTVLLRCVRRFMSPVGGNLA